MMTQYIAPPDLVSKVLLRRGKLHAFEVLDATRTALLVIDMQNSFVKQGAGHAWIPEAASTCENINAVAEALRQAGGSVVWVKPLKGGELIQRDTSFGFALSAMSSTSAPPSSQPR